MSDFSLSMRPVNSADIKTGDRSLTFNPSMTEAQREGEIQDIENAIANSKKSGPYDSSLQITLPINGEPQKFLTTKIDLRDKSGLEFANKMISL